MIHVSIVIVHFNADQYTTACLKSLQSLKLRSARSAIVIVDNGSKEVYQVPQELRSDSVRVLRSESNLGFTGGNNLGMHVAIEQFNSDFVLLLNNDTTVEPSFLEEMVKTATADPQVGIVSPKIYFAADSEFHSGSYAVKNRGSVLWFAGGSIDYPHVTCFHRGVDEIDRGQFDHRSDTEFATGCAMLIKREVLEKVGTFDKRFFLYMEDADLSLRVREAGYELRFCPRAVVWHANAGSSDGAGSAIHTYYQTRNRVLFALKHFTLKQLVPVARLALSYVVQGSSEERRGVMHALTNQYGKQVVTA